MTEKPQFMTLRLLLEYVKKQANGDLESALDMPLSIGIHDGHTNFDLGQIFRDYPRFNAPRGDSPGSIRIECHTTNKRLVEDRNK